MYLYDFYIINLDGYPLKGDRICPITLASVSLLVISKLIGYVPNSRVRDVNHS